jgi:hypothetical protein
MNYFFHKPGMDDRTPLPNSSGQIVGFPHFMLRSSLLKAVYEVKNCHPREAAEA